MWLSRGVPEQAQHSFVSALSIFRRLGARPYAALTEEALSTA